MLAELLAFLLAFPVLARDAVLESTEDRRARLEDVAIAILTAARGRADVAAATAVQGGRETLYSLSWGSCDCRGAECDHGRAHSYWQWHRLPSEPESDWWALCQPEAVGVAAARVAARFHRCRSGDLDCFVGKYAQFGGLSESARPKWATERANAAFGLAKKLRKAQRKNKSRKRLTIANR